VSQPLESPEAVLRAWATANHLADMDGWAALVLDGFTYVHSNANRETKAEVIAAFQGGRRYRSWDIEETTTQEFGDTAIVTGLAHLGVGPATEAEPRVLHVRFTATLLQRDGWKLAAFQSTRLPE